MTIKRRKKQPTPRADTKRDRTHSEDGVLHRETSKEAVFCYQEVLP
jgi:hypothetical protein